MKLPKPNNIQVEKYVPGMSLFKKRLAKIKLSANESALGPSPKAKKEYIKVSKSFARYPDSSGAFLRETLSNKFKSFLIVFFFDMPCEYFPENKIL